MSISYKTVQRKNPLDPSAQGKFYATPVYSKPVTIKEIGDEVAERTGMSDTDTIAIIHVITKVIAKYVLQGSIVKLGNFGTFRPTISSEGTVEEKDFAAEKITRLRLRFSPGNDLRDLMKVVKFDKPS